MSFQIETAFVRQYISTLTFLVQQKGSRLRNSVRIEPLTGKYGFYDQIGATEAQQKTSRHGDSPIISTPHSRRRVGASDFEWGDLVDSQDKLRLLVDPASSYLQSAVWALGRKMDDVIIAAASGTAQTGEDGATAVALPVGQKIAVGASGLTLTKLLKAKEILDGSEADPEETRYMVVGSKQMSDLLNTTEIKSSDYNSVKALVQGQVDSFLGFNFIRSERLKKTGNDRFALAYTVSGILLALQKDIVGRIGERADKSFAAYAYACLTCGATRMEESRVVEIACLES